MDSLISKTLAERKFREEEHYFLILIMELRTVLHMWNYAIYIVKYSKIMFSKTMVAFKESML